MHAVGRCISMSVRMHASIVRERVRMQVGEWLWTQPVHETQAAHQLGDAAEAAKLPAMPAHKREKATQRRGE